MFFDNKTSPASSNDALESINRLLQLSDMLLGPEKTNGILFRSIERMRKEELQEEVASEHRVSGMEESYADLEARCASGQGILGDIDELKVILDKANEACYQGATTGRISLGDNGQRESAASATITISLHGPRSVVVSLANEIAGDAEDAVSYVKSTLPENDGIACSISTTIDTVQ